jgi:ABC-type antimicrobial peptide transport system permease subunit
MYTLISILGVAIAVTCVAGTLTFLDGVSASILSLSLSESTSDSGALDVQMRGRLRPFSLGSHSSLIDQVDREVSTALGEASDSVYGGFRSPTFIPSFVDNSDPLDRRRAFFGSVQNLSEATTLVSGSWDVASSSSDENVLEVLVENKVATKYGLAQGYEFIYSPLSTSSETLTVKIVALFERQNAESPIWRIVDRGFDTAESSFELVPMFVRQVDFPKLAEGSRTGGEASYNWLATVQPGNIRAGSSEHILERLDTLSTSMSSRLTGFQMLTAIDEALALFGERNTIAAVPMKTIMFSISGIALILVLLMGSHTTDLTSADDATVAARGASRRQRLTSTLSEALIVAGSGTIIGFIVGAFFIGPLGVSVVTDDSLFRMELPELWIVVASIAVGFAGAAIFATSTISAGSLLITRLYRNKSNQVGGPFFTRYYLDLVLVAIAALLAWQFSNGGVQLAEDALNDDQANQLSLALPAIGIIGIGAVAVRLLPTTFMVLAAIVSRLPSFIGRSVVFELGLSSLARRTSHQAKLVVMIAAATATAILLSSFESTITNSNIDQTAYSVGANVRATKLTYRSQWRIDQALSTIAEIDGVESVSGATRASGIIRGTDGAIPVTILGLEPDELDGIAWDRDGIDTQSTLESLDASEKLRGLPIPNEANWISAHVKPVIPMPDVGLVMKIADSTGRLHNLSIGTLAPKSSVGNVDKFECGIAPPQPEDDPNQLLVGGQELEIPPEPEWCDIGASLGSLREILPPGEPLTLEFLGFSRRPIERGDPPTPGSMYIDQIRTHSENSSDVILDFVNSPDRHTVGGGYGDYDARVDDADEDGAIISWSRPAFGTYRGIELSQPGVAHTVIGSNWIEEQGYEVGDHIEITIADSQMTVRIGGFTKHFPTLDPVTEPFIISSRGTVWKALALNSDAIGAPVNDIWISSTRLNNDGLIDDVRESLVDAGVNAVNVRQSVGAEESAISKLESQGWRYILGFGYAILIAVAIIGVVVHTVGGFSLRRVEFSVLRSLGLTKIQLTGMIIFESLTIILFAAFVGVAAGRTIALTTIPYLTGDDPADITPPMLLHTDWDVLAYALAAFAVAVIANLAFIAFMAVTRSVHAEIRMGSR